MRPSSTLWRAAFRWCTHTHLSCRFLPHDLRFLDDHFSTPDLPRPSSRQFRSLAFAKNGETWQLVAPVEPSSFQCVRLQRRKFISCGDGDEEIGLSKQHKESRVIGYSPEQLYAVVAAVDLYEDFVPWCRKSSVLCRKGEEFLEAELEIGFKFYVERYISHVELKRPTLIKTSVSNSNLFEYLTNVWEFKPGPTPGSCDLQFLVDFQFRSPLYRQVANMFFNEVVSRLVSSFEDRCSTVYGPTDKVFENAYGSQTA